LLKSLGLGTAGLLISESQSLPAPSETAEDSVQLHIYIEVRPRNGLELEKLYHSAYVPAIKVQDGFLGSRLLRHYESKSHYEIDISFRTEKQRAAWPRIQEVGEKITWQGLDVLA
jgi:hypothetical protein